GHSSPVVRGGQVFLTTADEEERRQYVMAFDRATGKTLWATAVHHREFMPLHPKNSHASATPPCDGKHVYCAFINHHAPPVTAVNLKGRAVWQTKAGAFRSEHGYGSSPVLYKSLVIVNGDSLKDCFVAALDTASGKVVWKTPRKTTGRHGDYATPV